MKRSVLLIGAFFVLSCGSSSQSPEDIARDLLAQMTLEEKVNQMAGDESLSGDDFLYHVPGLERLGVPPFLMSDGPRGVTVPGATTFPVGMSRGATWDRELEQRVGAVMGLELRALGGNVLLAPNINILRHPSWGRSQETYGEDVNHLGTMGVAFVQGVQENALATPKHYAANSIEDTRFRLNVVVDERSLREIYLPHFRRAVQEGGASAIMSAYNKVNGPHCSQNRPLLTEILKQDWGFDGFVMSDWIFGKDDGIAAANAGLDLEMPLEDIYGDALLAAVRNGDVDESVVDEAVLRMLIKKIEFNLDQPSGATENDIASDTHLAMAQEVATKGSVLLKNASSALPLDAGALTTIAVVGTLADTPNTGDSGSSATQPTFVVTPLQGLTEAAPSSLTIEHIDSDVLDDDAEATIAAADAVIVVVGLTAADEGENFVGAGDRVDLDLSLDHEKLVNEVSVLNDRVIVVLEGGGAITMQSWIDDVDALLMVWYPGQMGGHAIADLVYGNENPSGKLPITFPTDLDQLPPFDNESLEVTYGYFHGYRYVNAMDLEPLFPFGFGMSYTSFIYDSLSLDKATVGAGDTITATVEVTNSGGRAGTEIVQAYVTAEGSSVERADLDLRGFARVDLEADETKSVEITIEVDDLAYYDIDSAAWGLEPLTYTVHAGASSRDLPLSETFSVP